jgi:hypothetical protein
MFFLALLCTLDLPWISIINLLRKLFPTKAEIELKRQAKAELNKVAPEYKEEERPKKHKPDLIKPEILQNSEEEMLKRFKNALAKTNNKANNSRITPTELDITSRLSKRAISNNKYY